MPDDRAQDVTPAEPGTVIGPYQVVGELGRGGMGVVYRARDLRLDREVALKRPYPSLVPDLTQRQRFEREARAAAQLAHPSIVPIFEVLEQDGVPWLAMELVNGRSLRSLLEMGDPMPMPEVLRHAESLAGALAAAHDRGILHRDVNPKNIMVTTDGRALLTDFGLARLTRERRPDSESTETQENDVTRAGAVLGTPGYMSPEQALGRPVDPRSDLFCLGAVLYEMCTRTRAFSASDSGNVLDAVLHHEPPPLTQVRADAPLELDRIVRKLLSKEADERYQDAADVVADVRALRRQVDFERYGSGRSHPPARPPRRGRRRQVLGTVSAIVLGLAAWLALRPRVMRTADWGGSLLVAQIENDTGNPAFDATLRESLYTVLRQSTFVSVFPDDRLADALQRMRRARSSPLDLPTSRDLCQREGIRLLLTGSIRRIGPLHRVAVQVREPRSGAIVLSEVEQFEQPQAFFAHVDALAERVRGRLGESLPSIEAASVPLEKATTSSLEALRLYSAARVAGRAGDSASARALLQQATEVDPEFALAHARLADTSAVAGDTAKAVEGYARAHALSKDLPPREQYLIAARYHTAREEYEQAVVSLRALVGLDPDDLAAHHALALAYESTGQLPAAIAELRECLRIDPLLARAHGNLVIYLARSGQADDALAARAAAREKGVDSPYFEAGAGLAHLLRGDVDEARAAFDRMIAAGGPYEGLGRLNRVRVDELEGRWAEAAAQLDRDCAFYREQGNTAYEVSARNQRARLLWLRGDAPGRPRALGHLLK
jgi:serine/threonine protein kinase/tetratricopeptide (TPR) repeat protein